MVKKTACNGGDLDSIPGLGRSPGEGNGYPLQYSCLENPMDKVDYSRWTYKCLGIVKKVRYLKIYSGIYISPLNLASFYGRLIFFSFSLFREINKDLL